MDGIPALDLWDLVIAVFNYVPNKTEGPRRKLRRKPVNNRQIKHA